MADSKYSDTRYRSADNKLYEEKAEKALDESRVAKLLRSGVRNTFDSHIDSWSADAKYNLYHIGLGYQFKLQDSVGMQTTKLRNFEITLEPRYNQILSDKDFAEAFKKAAGCMDYTKAVRDCLHVQFETPYDGGGNEFAGFEYGYDDTFRTESTLVHIHVGIGNKTYKDDTLSRAEVAKAVIAASDIALDASRDIYQHIHLESEHEKDGKIADKVPSEKMSVAKRIKRQPEHRTKVANSHKDNSREL